MNWRQLRHDLALAVAISFGITTLAAAAMAVYVGWVSW